MYNKYVKLRDAKGVSDYRVAIETGIPKSTFSEWKSGRSNPKIEKLHKLAQYFGVPIEYFLIERKM
ncbi:MAG: helix-turn-helix transcriptional regulator [Bacteroidales bacterium]|nr:helix-turn-helix transcriptional regulator [Bacteroidales bacterium]